MNAIGAPGSIARYCDDASRSEAVFAGPFVVFAYAPAVTVRAVCGSRSSAESYAIADEQRFIVDVRAYGCRVHECERLPCPRCGKGGS